MASDTSAASFPGHHIIPGGGPGKGGGRGGGRFALDQFAEKRRTLQWQPQIVGGIAMLSTSTVVIGVAVVFAIFVITVAWADYSTTHRR